MSQKTTKIMTMALIFFLSLLCFSVGALVGKNFSDNQHKLTQIEKEKKLNEASEPDNSAATADETHESTSQSSSQSTPQSAPAATNAMGEEKIKLPDEHLTKELNDQDVAKLSQEFADDEAPADQKEIKTIKAATTADIKIEKNQAAGLKTETQRAVASLTKAAAVGSDFHYTVQVGSFPTAEEAKKTVDQLIAQGFKASQSQKVIKGATWHRVNVGLFGTLSEAQNYKDNFLKQTHMPSAIIQKVE